MKKLIIIILCINLLLLCGCASDTIQETITESTQIPVDGEFTITDSEIVDKLKFVYILTDKATGVEYIVFYRTSGASMSPRYNADGTLKIKGDK